jgi:hypothetical protein
MKVLLLVPLLLLTACSAGGQDSLATDDGPRDVLTVELDRGDGTPAESWTLECEEPAASTHPDAGAACAALEALDDPFAPLPDDMACTEIYGGPQEARVTGSWNRSNVDLTVHRRNGCEIGQWDSLVPLLPVAS